MKLSAILQETSGADKMPDKELAVVSVYNKTTAMIVYHNNGYLKYDIDEAVGAYEAADYILDEAAPDHGIWIWEGRITWSGGSYEYPDDVEPIYHTIQWRQPTFDEWQALYEQRNPFMPKPEEEVFEGFGRRTIL